MFLAAENWKQLPTAKEAVRTRKARESHMFTYLPLLSDLLAMPLS